MGPIQMKSATIRLNRCVYCNGTGEQILRVRLSDPRPNGQRVRCRHCEGRGGVAPVRPVSIGEFIGARLVFAARYSAALILLYLFFAGAEWLCRMFR